MKRFANGLLVLIMLCCFFAAGMSRASAADEGMDRLAKAKNLLAALDIAQDGSDELVTRARFADVYARANNIYEEGYESSAPFSDTDSSEYTDSIERLRDLGILSGIGDNRFDPDGYIMTEDVARLYVIALGLDTYMQANGSSYMETAYSMGLFDGLKVSDNITMDQLIVTTYNFLKAPVGFVEFSGKPRYTVDRDTDLLYELFKVSKITGRVIQNDMTGLLSRDAAPDGYVQIETDDKYYTAVVGSSNINSKLGSKLDIYIRENKDNDTFEVVCFEDRTDTRSVSINIEDLDTDRSDSDTIYYYKDGKSSSSHVNLSDFASFIVNGVYYDEGQFDLAMLEEYYGTIKCVSSGGSDYDVVIIEAYSDMFVKNVEHYNGTMRIYDTGTGKSLVLDDAVYDRMEIFHPNGAPASQFELQADMLLTVANSFGTERYIKIMISDKTAQGTIASYSLEDKKLTLAGGETYDISPSYKTDRVNLNAVCTLYIDSFGKVGWIEYDRTSVYSYGFMKKIYMSDGSESVMVKAMFESGKFSVMELASKTVIDGLPCKDPDLQYAELQGVDKIDNLVSGEYPFRYRVDEEGKIKEIDTPRVRNSHEDKNSFRVTSSGTNVICSYDYILGKETPLSANTVVFLIPNASAVNEINEESFYKIGNRSLLDTGGSNTYTAFKFSDDSLIADLVVRTNVNIGTGMNHDNVLFLVDKAQEEYDSSTGDVRMKVYGLQGNTQKSYFVHEKFDVSKLKGIGQGDVLRFSLFNNEIVSMDKVFIYNDDTSDYTGYYYLPTSGQKASSLAQIGTSYYYCGYVMKREGRLIEILPFDLDGGSQTSGIAVPNIPDWSITTRRVLQAPSKIAVFDPSLSRNPVYVGDLEDIPAYEDSGALVKVIVRYRSRSAQEMIVLKDEILYQ